MQLCFSSLTPLSSNKKAKLPFKGDPAFYLRLSAFCPPQQYAFVYYLRLYRKLYRCITGLVKKGQIVFIRSNLRR